jgi:signal transduction histidine kinase
VLDAVLVLALLVVGGNGDRNLYLHTPMRLPLALGLILPLLARRRWPTGVFAVLAAVAFVQWVLGPVLVSDAALLVGLYTVAVYRPLRMALLAAAVLELGVGLAVSRWAPPHGGVPGFVLLSGMATAALVLGVNVRTRRAYLVSLEDRALRAENERDQQARLGAAAERARIARELHDIVAHNLSVMIALADGAAFTARTSPVQAAAAARQVSGTGRQALAEMQRLLGVLRDDDLVRRDPQPDVHGIDDLVAQVRGTGLPTRVTVSGRPGELSATAQLTVYRLVQEALTNVMKHARSATEVRVSLAYRGPVVELDVVDDGHGPAGGASGGHGLTGMRERAAVFGGEVVAGPRDGGGWRVRARLDTSTAVPAGALP